MGQEISHSHFSNADRSRFDEQLQIETQLARDMFARGAFSSSGPVAGFELEAWLLDHNCYPTPCNESFLARLDDPLVVPELSRFNVELNGTPQFLTGKALTLLEQELTSTWDRCVTSAHADGATMLAIGTLPTLRESDLDLNSMTPSKRYVALNEQVLRARGGRPLKLAINGASNLDAPLRTTHADLMLEAATTSFQVHLQVSAAQLGRYLNASMVLSGPLVALSANSPFLFGHRLWHETRIPLFEQSVDCGDDAHEELRRVTFGSGYIGDDPTSYFTENAERYPVLLPVLSSTQPEKFSHLRLQNGTLWRWNRLLIGFEDNGAPHLRIEQRVMPAGPTIIDMIANAAFYYGAVHRLATQSDIPEKALSFKTAKENFYTAARDGLEARLTWLNGLEGNAAELLQQLLPIAREGMLDLGIDADDIDRYLDLLRVRLQTGMNGAAWQLAHFSRYQDLFRLTAEYLEHQRTGMPVHEWQV